MKRCSQCGETKPLDAFARRPDRRSGRASACKACANVYHEARRRLLGIPARKASSEAELEARRERRRVYQAEYRRVHREAKRAYFLEYNRTPARRALWKVRSTTAAYRARQAVSRAVKAGRLERPPACSACARPCKPHAHHHDYTKPLEVEWLCPECHTKRHRAA